jgi:RNA polymerase sigma-70 factor (ECF subfamily)
MPEGDWLIQGLRQGDPQAVRVFCERYGPLLQQVAARHLPQGLRRRVGPETIGESACRSFLRRARADEFELPDCENLWRLLTAITLTKVREQIRFHRRQKRNIDQEVPLTAPAAEEGKRGLDPEDHQPSPAEAAEFRDQFEQLMASLDEEEQRLVDLKLQQYTNQEVAERMGCSERTVRRLLERVRARLERAFPVN